MRSVYQRLTGPQRSSASRWWLLPRYRCHEPRYCRPSAGSSLAAALVMDMFTTQALHRAVAWRESPGRLFPGRSAAADWTNGDSLGAIDSIMLLERDAALASSVRTAAIHTGPGDDVIAVMGALRRPAAPDPLIPKLLLVLVSPESLMWLMLAPISFDLLKALMPRKCWWLCTGMDDGQHLLFSSVTYHLSAPLMHSGSCCDCRPLEVCLGCAAGEAHLRGVEQLLREPQMLALHDNHVPLDVGLEEVASAADYGVRLALLESLLRLSCRPEVRKLHLRHSINVQVQCCAGRARALTEHGA